MTKEKLDFNEIIKRSGGPAQKDRAVPSELFQCVVFYGRPVTEEVPEIMEIPTISFFAKNAIQAIQKQRFVFPFYSKEIFGSQSEAQNFLPIFIRRLIKEEKLPSTVLNEDLSVNDDILKLGVAPLTVTILEQEKSEFKG